MDKAWKSKKFEPMVFQFEKAHQQRANQFERLVQQL